MMTRVKKAICTLRGHRDRLLASQHYDRLRHTVMAAWECRRCGRQEVRVDDCRDFAEQRPADYDWSRQLAFLAARGIAAEVRIANGKSAVYREGEELIGRDPSVEPERPKYAHRPGLPGRG